MIRGLILQTRNELVSHGFGNFAKPVEAMGDRIWCGPERCEHLVVIRRQCKLGSYNLVMLDVEIASLVVFCVVAGMWKPRKGASPGPFMRVLVARRGLSNSQFPRQWIVTNALQ